MKRLVIVAGQMIVVEAIRNALRQTTGFTVVGYVDGRQSVAGALGTARPDVVIVDDMDDHGAALARIAEVHAEVPGALVVVLAEQMDAEWLDEAVAAGAHSAICKAVHPVSLGVLVREIAAGNVYHRLPARPAAARLRDRAASLTTRELEILRLVAAGGSNSRIARELWVTEQTVKFHLSNIYRKLGVQNRTQASHYAHVNRLLDETPLALAS
jgi:DNA-binding NarL/FixJ family response regulator